MKKRILSALILVPLAVYLILFSSLIVFNCFIIFISLIAFVEWLSMGYTKWTLEKFLYVFLEFIFVIVLLLFKSFAVSALFFIFLAHMIIGFFSDDIKQNYYFFGGIIYVSLYTFFSYFKVMQHGEWILLLIFVSIWIGDSFAYFYGKKFGRLKLSPKISPNKTIEGAICGILFGIFASILFASVFNLLNFWYALLIGLIANVAGLFGDLSESVIKRFYNRKDSSNLIPGHGGVLDRLDSPAFSVFLIYMLFLWKIL